MEIKNLVFVIIRIIENIKKKLNCIVDLVCLLEFILISNYIFYINKLGILLSMVSWFYFSNKGDLYCFFMVY